MVADALIYHPAVSHYNKFVATTVGRDKTLRTIQYFSRFLAWYTYRTNQPQATVAVFETLKKNFGLVRKCMRLGKFVEHFKAAAIAADSTAQKDPVLKWLAVGRQLGYALYLTFDALTYPDAAGIKKSPSAAGYQQTAYKAWLFGLTCNIAAGAYTLYGLRVLEQRKVDTADAEKAVEQKKLAMTSAITKMQLVSDLCDFTVPTSALGYIDFDDGIVGLAGTVSSLIGLYGAWAQTA